MEALVLGDERPVQVELVSSVGLETLSLSEASGLD